MRRIGRYDTRLWGSALAIIAVSLVLLMTTITAVDGSIDRGYGIRQLIFAIAGLIIALIVGSLDLERLSRFAAPMYGLALAGIVIVMLVGTEVRGSRRWIALGPVSVQPSEFAKVLVLLVVAAWVTARIRQVDRLRTVLGTLAVAALPAGLVYMQPDFGTAQVFGIIGLAAIWFAGVRWLHLAVLGGSVLAMVVLVLGVLPAFQVHVLKPYQVQRLTGFAHPGSDQQGSNYQTIQAKIAIGSGQTFGKGHGTSSQVSKGYLPEPHTDFIFANLVEHWGFIGGAFVLALYMLLISRCLQATALAPTVFGRIVGGCAAAMFGWQVAVNVGMSVGLMPITGVPLPLLSYGGSAMLANLVTVGLVSGVLRSAESASARYAKRIRPLAPVVAAAPVVSE